MNISESISVDELLPGDKFMVSNEFTVESIDDSWHGLVIETEEGTTFNLSENITVTEAFRPVRWPAQLHDVWNVGNTLYHYLNDGWYDENGFESELTEILEGYVPMDMKLEFRYETK